MAEELGSERFSDLLKATQQAGAELGFSPELLPRGWLVLTAVCQPQPAFLVFPSLTTMSLFSLLPLHPPPLLDTEARRHPRLLGLPSEGPPQLPILTQRSTS